MKTITSILDYCTEINIPPPRTSFFDIRKFEDNMKTVNAKQPSFRHEFYAIALRLSGDNKEVNGRYLDSNLFFNSPYQIISWDIKPDWTGWYIIFDKEFIAQNPAWQNFIIDFPFFRLDKVAPVNLPFPEAEFVDDIFNKIFEEYHSNHKDKFLFIRAFTQLLLITAKRYFQDLEITSATNQDNRTADILLISRFQSMVETMLTNEDANPEVRSPSYYAEKLLVHPNHLNAVVKRITGQTATEIIQKQFLNAAKSLLKQTTLSVKEIGYRLHFREATHFNSFFKKMTGLTPQQFREKGNL